MPSLINSIIPITPAPQPDCVKIAITNVVMPLNNSCTIYVNLYDASGNILQFKQVVLEGEVYSQWTDDASLLSLIMDNLGVTPAPPSLEEA